MKPHSLLLPILLTILTLIHATPPTSEHLPTKKELQAADKDVNAKLAQLHSVIDALQETVAGLKGGYDKHAQESAEKMQKKFERLTAVVSKLGQQKNELYSENKRLRGEKAILVDKITALETQLRRQAEALRSSGAQAWLRKTAQDLRTFLEESGLEHFASPQFSPLVAGLVSNGVVVVPLSVTSMFLLRYVKHLTVLRVVMALNLFDLGFAAAMIASSLLLLGDAFEGLRHISEVNFMFIQLVIATVFWLTCAFLVWAIVQNRKNAGWKYAAVELSLRGLLAVNYNERVWSPVMAREDIPIGLSPVSYAMFLLAAVAAIKLTALSNTCSEKALRQESIHDADPEAMNSLVTHHVE